MNVGDWVEIDTGFYKGTLAQVYAKGSNSVSVTFWDAGMYRNHTYFGDSLKQKPTAPIKEYEDLFL